MKGGKGGMSKSEPAHKPMHEDMGKGGGMSKPMPSHMKPMHGDMGKSGGPKGGGKKK